MMKKLLQPLWLSIVFCFSYSVGAQNGHSVGFNGIVKMAMVKINGPATIDLALEAPEDAGLPVQSEQAIDSSLWLSYTVVASKQQNVTLKVAAQVSNGSIPNGLQLKVLARNAANGAQGRAGTPTGEKNLSSSPVDIISDIESSATGAGIGRGHRLIYRLALDDDDNASSLMDYADNNDEITLTYTIMEQ